MIRILRTSYLPCTINTVRFKRYQGCDISETWERKTTRASAWYHDNIPFHSEGQHPKSALTQSIEKISNWFQDAVPNSMKNQHNQYVEGFINGYQKGRWKGRIEAFVGTGAALGFYSTIILLRNGQKAS